MIVGCLSEGQLVLVTSHCSLADKVWCSVVFCLEDLLVKDSKTHDTTLTCLSM